MDRFLSQSSSGHLAQLLFNNQNTERKCTDKNVVEDALSKGAALMSVKDDRCNMPEFETKHLHPFTGKEIDAYPTAAVKVSGQRNQLLLLWRITKWQDYRSWRIGNCVYSPQIVLEGLPFVYWLFRFYPNGIRPEVGADASSFYLQLNWLHPKYKNDTFDVKHSVFYWYFFIYNCRCTDMVMKAAVVQSIEVELLDFYEYLFLFK